MIEDFIAVSALVSALVSIVAASRAWTSLSSARSDLVEKLLAHTEELKIKSVDFSRDNDLSQKEIEALGETILKIQSDLVRLQEQKKRLHQEEAESYSKQI